MVSRVKKFEKIDFENIWRLYSFEYQELAEHISLSDFGHWKALQAFCGKILTWTKCDENRFNEIRFFCRFRIWV